MNARTADAAHAELSPAGLAVVLLGLFMALADFFIVNVALPSISTTLAVGAAGLELVVAGYGTAYAVLLVIGGRLGDTHGRRRVFVAGVLAFTAASALCGFAPNIEVLVGARIVQGAAAALFVPQVLATIQSSLHGDARHRALAWYGATLGSGAVVGQLAGGVLVQLDIAGLAWRPVFLVNLPIGIAAAILGSRLVPETRSARPAAPDVVGAVLLGLALLGLLIPATMGRELDWPVWILACLPVFPIGLVALIAYGRRIERDGREPLLPSSLLGLAGIRAGIAVAMALFLAAGGFFLTTAISLQDGLSFGPLEAGLTVAPFALAFLVASLSGRRVAAVLGSRIVSLGGLFYAVGMATFAIQAWLGYSHETLLSLAPSMLIAGTGQGLIVAPLMGIALAEVPSERAGTASGLMTTIIQAALAVGAAGVGVVFFGILGPGGIVAFGHASAAAAVVQAVLGAAVAIAALALPEYGAARTAPADTAEADDEEDAASGFAA